MIEVLLVDDESYVTASLVKTIPWQELGVEKVYEASSPIMALQIMEEQSIDIVVTDIKMPGMSGLELIELVNDRWPHVSAMLLTGYSDFEYAKKALQLKAIDYLLKPVKDDQFIESLSNHIIARKDESRRAVQYDQMVDTMKSGHAVLRRNLMQELLVGKQFSENNLSEKLEQYSIPISYGDPVLLMTVQLGDHLIRMERDSSHSMEYAIGKMAKEVFSESYHVWHSGTAFDDLVIVLSVKDQVNGAACQKDQILEYSKQLQTKVNDYLQGEITLVISERTIFPQGIPKVYGDTLSALYKLQLDEVSVIFTEDIKEQLHTTSKAIEQLYKPPTLIHLLETAQWQAIKNKIGRLFDHNEKYNHTREGLYEVFIAITNGVIYVANKHGIDSRTIDTNGSNLLFDRRLIHSPRNLRAWADQMITNLEIQLMEDEKFNQRHIIQQVQELVENELGTDTSVKTIADRVHFHPVYLSKMYKQETGESLGDYITRIRMERAVYLLKSTNKKMYEITTELGYQNPQYFSKIFKKHYGCTPNEYRNQ